MLIEAASITLVLDHFTTRGPIARTSAPCRCSATRWKWGASVVLRHRSRSHRRDRS